MLSADTSLAIGCILFFRFIFFTAGKKYLVKHDKERYQETIMDVVGARRRLFL